MFHKNILLIPEREARKYRDERRPRQGLLRAREFLMKDLYTFDYTPSLALETYDTVRKAYADFFNELKMPYLVAEADSGNMGGTLSHEFHFTSAKGEDHVVSCSSCDYVANEELAETRLSTQSGSKSDDWKFQQSTTVASDDLETSVEVRTRHALESEADPFHIEVATWTGITKDRLSLVNAFYPWKPLPYRPRSTTPNEINIHAIKSIVPGLDAGIENPIDLWRTSFQPFTQGDNVLVNKRYSKIINIFDSRLPPVFASSTFSNHADFPLSAHLPSYLDKHIPTTSVTQHPTQASPLNLLRIRGGDLCPRCPEGQLKVQKTVELAHTFFLSNRYSKPLRASVAVPTNYLSDSDIKPSDATRSGSSQYKSSGGGVELQMGCHGIGISRMIGAVADCLADDNGLNWPRVIAPFEVVVIPNKGLEKDAVDVYDTLVTSSGLGEPVLASSGVDQQAAHIDAILDDREKDLAWKLRDADLIGFPVIVVLGRAWRKDKNCEVQCRRLGGLKTEVPVDELPAFVSSLLGQM
jgi:prolyl-tRNA synthetase